MLTHPHQASCASEALELFAERRTDHIKTKKTKKKMIAVDTWGQVSHTLRKRGGGSVREEGGERRDMPKPYPHPHPPSPRLRIQVRQVHNVDLWLKASGRYIDSCADPVPPPPVPTVIKTVSLSHLFKVG